MGLTSISRFMKLISMQWRAGIELYMNSTYVQSDVHNSSVRSIFQREVENFMNMFGNLKISKTSQASGKDLRYEIYVVPQIRNN